MPTSTLAVCLQLIDGLIDWLFDNNSMNANSPMAVTDCMFLLFRNILYIFTFHIF